MKNLRDIAEINELRYIETTSQSNGYPESIKGAIIGFDSFEQAQQIAEKENLSIEFFKKKDGWQLWYRTNNIAHEPMTNKAEDYGDDYAEIGKVNESDFVENEVLPYLEDLDRTDDCNFDFLQTLIAEKKKVFEEIQQMEADEIVITRQGQYYDTIKKQSMYWSHDTNHIAIGLICRD